MLADLHLDLTKAMDIVLDAEGLLGTKRYGRSHCMHASGGVCRGTVITLR
jgi:hypothetical protein